MILNALRKHLEQKLHNAGLPRREVELLLTKRLELHRHLLYLEGKREIPVDVVTALESDLRRRLTGEPLQLILGSVVFHGLELEVRPDVFIPRPETEVLVELALELASGTENPLLDLCCGSGAIACALAAACPNQFVVAVDANPTACRLTRDNAERLGLTERSGVIRGDLAVALGGPFGLIACNPPYIPTDELPGLPVEVREHDPQTALDGGTDGLVFYRRLAPELPRLLEPCAWAMFEIGDDQGDEVKAILAAIDGLAEVAVHPDLTGRDRVVVTRRRS